MKDRIKIALTTANNQPVSLKALTPEALDSFLIVVSSLKSIATNIIVDVDLNFVISEGSAACAIEVPDTQAESIFKELDIAIKGKSEDREITKSLRAIQDQVKRLNYKYTFNYYKTEENTIKIHEMLASAGRISIRRRRTPFTFKIKIVSGFLNLIGGKNPNYHFDYGGGQRLTIDCTKEEAMAINGYLYQNVHALLLCKEWSDESKKDEYYHKAIIDNNSVGYLKKYLRAYYQEEEMIKRLSLTYDFVDEIFQETEFGHKILRYLLTAFNNKNFHLSEIKTILVISKPFRDHELIQDIRIALKETYENKKS